MDTSNANFVGEHQGTQEPQLKNRQQPMIFGERKSSVFDGFSAAALTNHNASQQNSNHLWPFVAHIKFQPDRSTGGQAIARTVSQPGPETAKIMGFLTVFQLVLLCTFMYPNQTRIVCSHTLARLPRKISARLAHRGRSNRPASFLAAHPSMSARKSDI